MSTLTDSNRLQEIVDLDLFSEDVRFILDDMTELAAKSLNVPSGYVSLILDEAQYFASMYGVEAEWIKQARGTEVQISFCKHVVESDSEFVVENATQSELMKDSPLVIHEGIRCYAGIPMITSKGITIGSFCVSGTAEKTFTDKEMDVLRTLAKEVVFRIETRAGRKLDY